MSDQFTCESCGRTFDREPGDVERAQAEALALFGVENVRYDPDFAEVCDDCWQEMARFFAE